MADILDVSGRKLATLGDDEKVRDMQGIIIGSVSFNGDIYNAMARKVGTFEENGDIYQEGKKTGRVDSVGMVYDYENQRVGKVVGGNIKLGGAALLLLVR